MMRLVVSLSYRDIVPGRRPTRGSGLGGVVDMLSALAAIGDVMVLDDEEECIAHAAVYSNAAPMGTESRRV